MKIAVTASSLNSLPRILVRFVLRHYMYGQKDGAMAQMRDDSEVEEVVRAHAGWVYASARRRVRDEALAEDVTQAVFILFWRKQASLTGETQVTGWLYRAARYCAANALRLKRIRQRHEKEAAMAGLAQNAGGKAEWEEISPELESAVDRLGRGDRSAVLLRFYRQMSFSEVGQSLGISEEAARKRVERSLEKLRGLLGKKGVMAGVGALGVIMSEKVTEAAPAGLVKSATAATAGGGGMGSAGLIAKGAIKMMAWVKVKVAAMFLAGIGLPLALVGAVLYAESGKATSGGTSVQPTPAQQAVANPTGERVLSFPAGVTLGTLYLRDDGPHTWPHEAWKFVAPAARQVRISAGKQVELRVSRGAVNQLAGLKALPYDSIYRVSLDFTDADDAAVAEISHLKGLKSLALRQTQVTDGVATALGKLTQLEDLDLESTKAGPKCLAAIKSLKNLRDLGLWGTKVTNASLRNLAGMNNLEVLDLGNTHITDQGVILMGELPKLRWLRLNQAGIFDPRSSGVTDRPAGQIARWTSLESLDLENTAITDEGVALLSKLPHLKELRIGNTRVTDAAMTSVAAIKTLEKLKLPEGITNAGLASLVGHPSLKEIEGMAAMDDESLAILARLPALEAIELCGPRITDAGMEQVAKMRSLRQLTLSCGVSDEGFAKLMPLQSLEELSLSGTRMTPQGLVALSKFAGLTFLRLGDSALVHGGLKHVAGMGSIKTLCLQGNALPLDDAVLADVGQLSGLQELQVQNRRASQGSISDSGMAQLAKLTKLEQLGLDTPGTLTDRSLVSLSGLRELGFLRLHGTFTDNGLRALEGMPSLASLLLPGDFSERAQASLREHTPALRGLIILDTEEQLQVIAQIMKCGGTVKWATDGPAVEVMFGLKSAEGLTDSNLEHIKLLTHLKRLDLYGARLTDDGLKHLEGLDRLQLLGLGGTNVTDAGLEHLKNFKQLETLDLGSTKLTGVGLQHLKGLNALRSLSLANTQVSDAALEPLEGLSQLQSLELLNTQVTDAGLEHLKALKQLKSLGLAGTKVTSQGVKALQEALPTCQITPTGAVLTMGQRPARAASLPATLPSMPPKAVPPAKIKIGIMVSDYSANSVLPGGNTGFSLIPRLAGFFRDSSTELYPVIEPGTAQSPQVAAMIRAQFTTDPINGADPAELRKLDMVFVFETHLRASVLDGIEAAVNDGLPLMCMCGMGMVDPGYTPQLSRLLGLGNASYHWVEEPIECVIVSDHPLTGGSANKGKVIRLLANGAWGKLPGTPLIQVNNLADIGETKGMTTADGRSFCPFYISQLGKGRIVGINWAPYGLPKELMKLAQPNVYLSAAKWLASQKAIPQK